MITYKGLREQERRDMDESETSLNIICYVVWTLKSCKCFTNSKLNQEKTNKKRKTSDPHTA